MSNRYYLGIDTSAYTTSIAVIDEKMKIVADYRKLLEVKKGARGLRQQEAVFQHINNIPAIIKKISEDVDLSLVKVVSASVKPRNQKHSYMPVFKVAEGQAFVLSKALNAEFRSFSHQDGHIAAGLLDCGLANIDTFLTLHISGGTTELLKVKERKDYYRIEIIGGTKDLSAGQLIDRIGVKLGLKFPCGKEMDYLVGKSKIKDIKYPVSTQNTYINFSGLETYFYSIVDKKEFDNSSIAANLFYAIGDSLIRIIKEAISLYLVKDILVVGGVASNTVIRKLLFENIQQKGIGRIYIPNTKYCTDNAVGIAYLGAIKNGYNKEVYDYDS